MRTEHIGGMGSAALIAERMAKAAFLLIILLLAAARVGAIDLVGPANNTYSGERHNEFEYYVGNSTYSSCTLTVDSAPAATKTNISQGFNSLPADLLPGAHNWKISCTGNATTDISDQRKITVDEEDPSVVLFSPQNNDNFTVRDVTFGFVPIDNYAGDLSCDIKIDGNTGYSATLNNSVPQNIAIHNIADGVHTWKITCRDLAQNSKDSEERAFSVNTTPTTPVFGLALPRHIFSTGEQASATVSAPAGTSARIEVCPDQTGFVQCITALNIQNATSFPVQAGLPFLNYEGRYVLEAQFTKGNFTETKTERYNVTSTISLNYDYSDRPRKNEPVLLEADASGGVGKVNYTWSLSDGTKRYERKANITYTTPGNYSASILVVDTYNNSRNATFSFEVSNSYAITVLVKNQETGAAVAGATVNLDSQDSDTDASGKAVLYARPGNRDIIIAAPNYSIYKSEIQANSDQTVTASLSPLNATSTGPVVQLTYPPTEFTVPGTTTEVGFSVQSKYQANCSVYISEEENKDFFIYLGSTTIDANSNSEKRFEIIDLENKTYYWKVECTDTGKKTASSETRSLRVGVGQQPTDQTRDMALINSRVAELELVMKDTNSLPNDLKEAITEAGLLKELDDSIKAQKNLIRDLDSLSFQQIAPEQKQSQTQAILAKSDSLLSSTPVFFELGSWENYVDYIEKDELEGLAKEYIQRQYGDNTSINLKRALSLLDELQQEVVISTKTRTIRYRLNSGAQLERTLVMKDIKTYNLTQGAMIVDIIPKDVASSASEVISSLKFTVIKSDPIIAFPISKDMRISYYFNKSIDKERLKGIRTAVFADLENVDPEYVTGFSITELLPGSGGGIVLPILIAILLGGAAVGIVRFEGVKVAQYTAYLLKRSNSLHYINVVIGDIHDSLQAGNIEKAAQLYEEAKAAYTDLPHVAKNDIYESIAQAASKIEEYNASVVKNDRMSALNELMINAERMLSQAQVTEAIGEYKKIESLFHELSDGEQAVFHQHIVDLGNKLQVMIASNQKGSFE